MSLKTVQISLILFGSFFQKISGPSSSGPSRTLQITMLLLWIDVPLKGLIGNATTFCAEFRWAISLSDFEISLSDFEIAQRRNSAQNVVAFPTDGMLEKITSSISTSLDVRPDVQIFKRPKNREDGSKFDDFRTKWIVSARPISGKKIEITKQSKSFRKISKNFRKFFRIFFRTM